MATTTKPMATDIEPMASDTEPMASEVSIIERLNTLLHEEKWTRTTLTSYSTANFKEFDEFIEQIRTSGSPDEVLHICEEHMYQSKNSIVALYIAGIIKLERQAMLDNNMITLIDIFIENHKWNIIEHLCKKLLEFGENKYALRTLADCYNNSNNQTRMLEVWERLIKVDLEEADIVRRLAEIREQNDDIAGAIEYYKRSFYRYLNSEDFNSIREIWNRLVELVPEDMDFFMVAESKIAKQLGEDRPEPLLNEIYTYYREKGDWSTAIDILKRILHYNRKNSEARKEIIACYEKHYAKHSHLQEFIRISNLNQSWRNVHEAIADFEKHISFDAGNFVFHRSWAVGIIREVKGDTISIDFAKKRNHSMSLRMAIGALDILPRDHIWVLRSIWNLEKLQSFFKKNIVQALKIVIKSCGNVADMKLIKKEAVPHILSQSEWYSWSIKARNILRTNNDFGPVSDKSDHFEVRIRPISYKEKVYNRFRAERDFFARTQILLDFLTDVEKGSAEADLEIIGTMLESFVGFLKNPSTINESVIASLFVVERVYEKYPYLKSESINQDFKTMISNADYVAIHSNLKLAALKQNFLVRLRNEFEDWPKRYLRIFSTTPSRWITNELASIEDGDYIGTLIKNVFADYWNGREAFIWLIRNCATEPWFQKQGIKTESILLAMIHLLDVTAREMDNRRNVVTNKKLQRQIHNYLFKEHNLHNFFEQADRHSIERTFELLEDVKELDPALLIELKQKVLDRFPKFKFFSEESKETTSRGFMATMESYQQKQRELQHLHEVDVPENSREIGAALQMGDLRENAEYKAALERQEILNSTAARLKDELNRVQVASHQEGDTDTVSFGSKVTLYNEDTEKQEHYSVLGPWESDPDRAIISYLSPFGRKLYNRQIGENLDFEINERHYRYRIEAIERVV